MSEPTFTHDVFLSHSSEDKVVVRAVAERLRKDGLKVWFDAWVIKPGDSIPAKVEEGLEHLRFGPRPSSFGFAQPSMSANAFDSDWAQLLTHPQPSTLNAQPASAPLNPRKAASFPCGSTTPPSKAPLRNSFTSTGAQQILSPDLLGGA
jgi:hypothetical protein